MWRNLYKDYQLDQKGMEISLEPGKHLIGTEMRETQGWQNTLHYSPKRKPKRLLKFLSRLMNKKFK